MQCLPGHIYNVYPHILVKQNGHSHLTIVWRTFSKILTINPWGQAMGCVLWVFWKKTDLELWCVFCKFKFRFFCCLSHIWWLYYCVMWDHNIRRLNCTLWHCRVTFSIMSDHMSGMTKHLCQVSACNVPDDYNAFEIIRENVIQLLQVMVMLQTWELLQTYWFIYSSLYDCIHLNVPL